MIGICRSNAKDNVRLGLYPTWLSGMLRPYGGRRVGNQDHPVNVIRHHDKFIQCDVSKMTRDVLPARPGDLSRFIQSRLSVHDLPKHTFAIARYDRNKICAWLGIIIALQSDRAAAMFERIVFHGAIAMLGRSIRRPWRLINNVCWGEAFHKVDELRTQQFQTYTE